MFHFRNCIIPFKHVEICKKIQKRSLRLRAGSCPWQPDRERTFAWERVILLRAKKQASSLYLCLLLSLGFRLVLDVYVRGTSGPVKVVLTRVYVGFLICLLVICMGSLFLVKNNYL
jgi:hypothetical protein